MKNARKRWLREDREFVRANAGKMTTEEMAEKLGVSVGALQTYASRNDISLKMFCATEHDISLCRELYKEGLTTRTIARKMELSNQAVFCIVYSGY
ncbi:hypothetical protein CB283_13635 [Salmonella enterica subsp. enterica serovar Kisangani]|nr:hypothetical protein [Salmonella enterica subsp. enterica serovar Kisangani]